VTFRYVFLGPSRSSRSNEHATTFRALLGALSARGHDVSYIERDDPSAAPDVELPVATHRYGSLTELFDGYASRVREADLVVVGSRVTEGASIGSWALELSPLRVAFYDLDPATTLRGLEGGSCPYVSAELVSRYSLYLSLASGPTLDVLRRRYDAPWVRPLLPCVDPEVHAPDVAPARWDLGYLATDAEPRTSSGLLVEAARQCAEGRFVIAGAADPAWPSNVERHGHVPPAEQRAFYGAQRFTLASGRGLRSAAGWAPSGRLFEAAACAASIVSEPWPGLEEMLRPGTELLVVRTAADVVRLVRELPEPERLAVAAAARRRVLAEHTSASRAETLERYTRELLERWSRRSRIDLSTTDGDEA
jgi:spore maturation protein CgeB